jgi:UDP-N-acetylmuramate dehydrogenase
VLGAGSNLLVADEGPSFVVIATTRLSGEPRIEGDTAVVAAGFPVPRLVTRLQRAGLAGLEFAEGIPGSVGGAVRMNAGWHEGEFGNTVASLIVVGRDGAIDTVAAGPDTFSYRRSPGVGDRIVAEATLRLTPDDPARIAEQMRGFRDHRVRTQPAGERNAGCMFKNPPGDHAGRLIDSCGLKGWTVGRAQVSPVHANFFVNLGGATFRDVALLMDRARDVVARRSGVSLEPEVILWR